jgi:hypothetical protein
MTQHEKGKLHILAADTVVRLFQESFCVLRRYIV